MWSMSARVIDQLASLVVNEDYIVSLLTCLTSKNITARGVSHGGVAVSNLETTQPPSLDQSSTWSDIAIYSIEIRATRDSGIETHARTLQVHWPWRSVRLRH